ncbi:hypothetical protein CE91St41_18490 [Oscillospiraceae bacterium]|nr:hypothetical protein CE91St40_19030 [Oscillospiraceae bacterium]BDF74960.1 hypothetical protein CE91St41_18490 [Oscillospiraceae bacterium]
MFGYVRPLKDELRVRELHDYEAAYCGLCRAIGRRNGFPARMFLNYDFAFLAMLLSPAQGRPEIRKCRCPARLWCTKKACAVHPGLDAAADESTILSYWKLRDTVADGSFWARLGARACSLLLRPSYRRAAALRPEFDRQVCACLEELRGLEGENCPSLDRTADTFARILRAAAPPTGDEGRDRGLGELLYHVGRWIYLVDAWDDLEEDRRTGGYNPVSARFPGAEAENRDYLRTTLRHSRNLAAAACALLEPGCWGGVLENILYLGLPAVEELVFTGRWNKKSNRRTDT